MKNKTGVFQEGTYSEELKPSIDVNPSPRDGKPVPFKCPLQTSTKDYICHGKLVSHMDTLQAPDWCMFYCSVGSLRYNPLKRVYNYNKHNNNNSSVNVFRGLIGGTVNEKTLNITKRIFFQNLNWWKAAHWTI